MVQWCFDINNNKDRLKIFWGEPYLRFFTLGCAQKAEYYLSRVEQSPSKSIESALSPYMKALVADKLFKHTDIDIKVAVASCISEITRISAPEAPYNDDLMKVPPHIGLTSFKSHMLILHVHIPINLSY